MNGERMACMYLLQRASLEGVSSETILEDMQLPIDFFEAASSHSIAEVLPKVMLSASRLGKKQHFGFEAAQHLHPCLLGPCGLAATHAPTLAEMFSTFVEFGNQLATWYQLESKPGTKNTTWTLHLLDSCDEDAAEHVAVAWAAAMTTFGRLAVGGDFQAERVSLIQSPPVKVQLLEGFLRCPITFDAQHNQMAISTDSLNKESLLSDAVLYDQLAFAASALKRQLDDSSIVDAVEQAIRLGSFDLPDISLALGMTERTVQRRLKDEGTTFQDRLDAVRLRMADTYLRLPSLTIEEIAVRIGFSGDKAFRAAYRRWTGRSPRETD
jgi:AraC-like DNA-binding protein